MGWVMLSLKDLFYYNIDYMYSDTLTIQFEGSNIKYNIKCDDLNRISNYPVKRFHGYEVCLLFSMRDSDKKYFKEIS